MRGNYNPQRDEAAIEAFDCPMCRASAGIRCHAHRTGQPTRCHRQRLDLLDVDRRIVAALKLHQRDNDSCGYRFDEWPCPTAHALWGTS